MPAWAARVATMPNPIQRDGLMLALFTGLRSEDVRTVRWEHVDLKERTLRLPDPKGGAGAAFTIPLSTTPLAILRRRKRDNAKGTTDAEKLVALRGGDHGWAFPGVTADGEVIAISDLRQQIKGDPDEGVKHGRFPAEDVHTLRRTWESIAHEEDVSELDQHVLSNHSFGSHNVNATYISQHLDHLGRCAAKIDAGITRRLKPAPSTKGKAPKQRAPRGRHLHSVA
jgi:integrase